MWPFTKKCKKESKGFYSPILLNYYDSYGEAYCDLVKKYGQLRRENWELNAYKENVEIKGLDKRIINKVLDSIENHFTIDPIEPITVNNPLLPTYGYKPPISEFGYRVLSALESLSQRVDNLEDITQRKVLEQRVKDLEEELELRTKQYEKLLKTIKE